MKQRDRIIAFVLILGFIVGVGLIVTDLNSNDDDAARLQIEGTSAAEISELTGLQFPDDLVEFRSALAETGEQVDIRFVATNEQVEQFIDDSNLPPLVAERRLLTHSSPVWELNPVSATTNSSEVVDGDDATETPSESDLLDEFNPNADLGQATLHLFRSTSDLHDDLVRVVETVDLEDGTYEVRVSVTTQPSGRSGSDIQAPDSGD